ncbi:hypothetical protein ABZ319_34680 [Nocardia sp. NPDC005978]|uniref:hypothetical protein n=1 Tax=Nocardia sp. NPDC005978 TaxID=3156725 RepID=UPI0033B46626
MSTRSPHYASTATSTAPSTDSGPAEAVFLAVAQLVGYLLAAVLTMAWWTLLFPMVSAPLALAVAAAWYLGWPFGLGVAALSLAELLLWRLAAPVSFHRFVTARARRRFLAWFRYRRRWASILTACGLTDPSPYRRSVPGLRVLAVGEHLDRVRVRMLPGQSPADYESAAVRMAHAFGAAECRVMVDGPAVLVLIFRYGDPLAAPIVLSDSGSRFAGLPRELPRRKGVA